MRHTGGLKSAILRGRWIMKRFWIMLLAVSVALVIALPAGAKPDKPKPPRSAPVAVYLDADPIWVHEGVEEGVSEGWVHKGDDVIHYAVKVQNKTSTTIEGVTVQFTAAGVTDIWLPGAIAPYGNMTWDEESLPKRTVSQFSETAATCGEQCELPATVTVLRDDEVLTREMMSTPLMPYPPCGFGDEPSGLALVSEVCIWTPPRTGGWRVSLYPTPPANANRPIHAGVTVRDHVPGNWCILPDNADGGVFGDRWKTDDDPITGEVYLPSNGECLGGGAGGESIKPVGNPTSFYLVAHGLVSVCDPSDYAVCPLPQEE